MKERTLLVLSLILILASLAGAQTARRTITNQDLEKYRQRREQQEADYRANYKKLGMPSPEELEQREAERQAWLDEFAKKARAENQETQGDFQARANYLKSQIAGVQAQIDYLRGLIGNLPERNSIFITPDQLPSVGIVSYGYIPRGNFGGGYYSPRNNVVVAPNAQLAINNAGAAPNPYAGTIAPQTGVKVVVGQPNYFPRHGGGFQSRPDRGTDGARE